MRDLVTTAFRYGGPTIEVAIRPNGATVEIEVSDNGNPIRHESREAIFRPCSRSDSSARIDSVGFGLPVAPQLAESMNGSLLHHHHGGHSRFVLTLPGGHG